MKIANSAIFFLSFVFLAPICAESVFMPDSACNCEASSSLGEKYSAYNMFDEDISTCWAAKGSKNLKLNFLVHSPLETLKIYTGYGKSKKLYFENNRPKKIRVSLSALAGWKDEVTETGRAYSSVLPVWSGVFKLKDKMKWRKIKLKANKSKQSEALKKAVEGLSEEQRKGAIKTFMVTIELLDVYKGSKYNDTCISEIEPVFSGRAKSFKSKIRMTKVENPEFVKVPVNEKTFVEISKNEDEYLFSFKAGNSKCVNKSFIEEDYDFFAPYSTPVEAGSVKLSKGRSVFLAAESASSGAWETILSVFNPEICKAAAIKLSFSVSLIHPFPHIEYSSAFEKSVLKEEKDFLLSLAPEYGYETPEKPAKDISDRQYAWYLWKKENPSEGPLKLRWYPGAPDEDNLKEAEIKNGKMIYTACFKGGVTQFDIKKNRFRPIYHAETSLTWPVSLLIWKNYLFIGTNGEGLKTINLKTMTLKNPPSEKHIQQMEIRNKKLYINGKSTKFKAF